MAAAGTPSIASIKLNVARHFDVPLRHMTSRTQERWAARPRQVAMMLAVTLGTAGDVRFSKGNVGRLFGGRDHSTVFHAVRATEQRMAGDDKECATVMAAMIDIAIDAKIAEAMQGERFRGERE